MNVNAERLASRAVSAALDPAQQPRDALQGVLNLVDAVDPQATATAVMGMEFDPSTASLSDLISFADAHGISLDSGSNGSVEPLSQPESD